MFMKHLIATLAFAASSLVALPAVADTMKSDHAMKGDHMMKGSMAAHPAMAGHTTTKGSMKGDHMSASMKGHHMSGSMKPARKTP